MLQYARRPSSTGSTWYGTCTLTLASTFSSATCAELHFKESSELLHHQCQPAGERPFRCAACGKSFKRPSDLRQHERTHSEERPFQCEECQMSFKQQYALVRHRRTHKNPADRPFKCNQCDKGFLQPSHLLYHQHVHGIESLFKCAACQKGFRQSGELLRHKCTESNSGSNAVEKPYKCDVCGKGLQKVVNLTEAPELPLHRKATEVLALRPPLPVLV